MSKEDIEKLDKQIELLKKDKNGNTKVEKVITEKVDNDDPNHVVNIDYIDSEVNENTKEIKDLNSFTTEENSNKLETTKRIEVNYDVKNEVEIEKNIETINHKNNINNKNLFIILGVIIGCLVLLLIILLFIFSGSDKNNTNLDDEKIELTEAEMIEIVKEYGKTLEDEVKKYYKENDTIPNFSTVNNLVDLEYEVVCYTHEVYEDKTIYLDSCMVDYVDVEFTYGTKKDIVDTSKNNINVYVNKNTKKATLEEPKDKENYLLYSYSTDSEIQDIELLDDSYYLTYYDLTTQHFVLYNYVAGKKALNKVDYNHVSTIKLYGEKDNQKKSSKYVILHFDDSTSKVYDLDNSKAVGEAFDTINQVELAKDRLGVCKNRKCGMINLKTGDLVIPLEYELITNSGSSVVAEKNKVIYIFDEDGNRYLEDILKPNTTDSAIYDKYVLQDKKVYNINGKVVCEFKSDETFTLHHNRVIGDQVIYHVLEEKEEKCYIFNIVKKDCNIVEIDECNNIY